MTASWKHCCFMFPRQLYIQLADEDDLSDSRSNSRSSEWKACSFLSLHCLRVFPTYVQTVSQSTSCTLLSPSRPFSFFFLNLSGLVTIFSLQCSPVQLELLSSQHGSECPRTGGHHHLLPASPGYWHLGFHQVQEGWDEDAGPSHWYGSFRRPKNHFSGWNLHHNWWVCFCKCV